MITTSIPSISHSVTGRATTQPVEACDRTPYSVAPKTVSCTSTDSLECRPHQHVGNCQPIHHRCLYRTPSSATTLYHFENTPYYDPLHLFCTEPAQAVNFQSAHYPSSCIPTFCIGYCVGCSQSNDPRLYESTAPIHAINPSYLQEDLRTETSSPSAAAACHQFNCPTFSYSVSPTSTLGYTSINPPHLYGVDHMLVPDDRTKSIRPNVLHNQNEWTTTSAFSTSCIIPGSQPLPPITFGERRKDNIYVASTEMNSPCKFRFGMFNLKYPTEDFLASWSCRPFDADHELFDDKSHDSTETTVPFLATDPEAQVLCTAGRSDRCTIGSLTPESEMLLPPNIDLTIPPAHQPEKRSRSNFLFVDNSDKETAARLRNVLTNRKQRMRKLSRVAELEEKLRAVESERDTWKRKAEFWRKALTDVPVIRT